MNSLRVQDASLITSLHLKKVDLKAHRLSDLDVDTYQLEERTFESVIALRITETLFKMDIDLSRLSSEEQTRLSDIVIEHNDFEFTTFFLLKGI